MSLIEAARFVNDCRLINESPNGVLLVETTRGEKAKEPKISGAQKKDVRAPKGFGFRSTNGVLK